MVNEHALVLELTASSAGEALDARLLSALATAVRSDDAALRCAWAALQSRLRTADANVRCRALLLAAHLFKRSKLFRELLASWLPKFIVCTLGSAERPLPPPRAAAARLHELAQRTLQQWTETWGEHYPALRVALRHVSERRDVAVASEAAAPADRAHARREERTRELARQRYFAFRPSVDAAFAAARTCLARLDSCVELLYAPREAPAAEDEEAWEAACGDESDDDDALRQAPPPSRPDAAEAAPDDTVLEALRGVLCDLRVHAAALSRAATELECVVVDDNQRGALLQEALTLKAAVAVAIQRYEPACEGALRSAPPTK